MPQKLFIVFIKIIKFILLMALLGSNSDTTTIQSTTSSQVLKTVAIKSKNTVKKNSLEKLQI